MVILSEKSLESTVVIFSPSKLAIKSPLAPPHCILSPAKSHYLASPFGF